VEPLLAPIWLFRVRIAYDVSLKDYPPSAKIPLMRAIREQFGVGLAEAKAIAESPTNSFPIWILSANDYRLWAKLPQRDATLTLRRMSPTMLPAFELTMEGLQPENRWEVDPLFDRLRTVGLQNYLLTYFDHSVTEGEPTRYFSANYLWHPLESSRILAIRQRQEEIDHFVEQYATLFHKTIRVRRYPAPDEEVSE